MSDTDVRAPGQAGRGTVLVVDDDEALRDLVCRTLERAGHEAVGASSVDGALALLAARAFDLVLTDLRFPGPSGLELMVEVRSRSPGTRLILMTAAVDMAAAAVAVEHGIDHLLIKPLNLGDVRARVEDSLARRRAARVSELERELLEARLRQRDTESKIWILRAAHALAHAVEAKDPFTAGHARRVTAYAMTIAEVTGGIDVLSFRLAGDLHDVGKIGVPDRVLRKPAPLSRREFDLVKRHTTIGARILGPLIEDRLVLDVVRCHHERWDGSGYPDGLRGDEIPFAARVLAVADTLDASTSPRAYREALEWDQAVDIIRRGAGRIYDAAVVAAMETALPLLAAHYQRFREEGAALAAAPPPA